VTLYFPQIYVTVHTSQIKTKNNLQYQLEVLILFALCTAHGLHCCTRTECRRNNMQYCFMLVSIQNTNICICWPLRTKFWQINSPDLWLRQVYWVLTQVIFANRDKPYLKRFVRISWTTAPVVYRVSGYSRRCLGFDFRRSRFSERQWVWNGVHSASWR
jgi:hypothetical protein